MTRNLVVANRMIILAPMWNLDTQAQAIKVCLERPRKKLMISEFIELVRLDLPK